MSTEALLAGVPPELENGDRRSWLISKSSAGWRDEACRLLRMTVPLSGAALVGFSTTIVQSRFVGQLGPLDQSAWFLSRTFYCLTGLVLQYGAAGALETFCGQAYGARQYMQCGIYLQRALLLCLVTAVPSIVLWMNGHHLILLLGMDHDIALIASRYTLQYSPSLILAGVEECIRRFLVAQGYLPHVDSSLAANGVSGDTFVWWGMVPNGLACASATRVAHAIGGGDATQAKLATKVSLTLGVVMTCLSSAVMLLLGDSWTSIFSKDPRVVTQMRSLIYLVGLSLIGSGAASTLSGTLRGVGRQKVGAYGQMIAGYVIGLPVEGWLAFRWKLGVLGLWLGQVVALEWDAEAKRAQELAFDTQQDLNAATDNATSEDGPLGAKEDSLEDMQINGSAASLILP